ncbi:efflux RND transporter periplasmic adaptor subunit [Streptobacillus felis]|uniref:Efflux RND transporter periplasmic adaptor subunit n=1 Tax=Streptobacillus felis TaxID=1384509 RepID=A0A7Z0TBH0_9FUSO|nr:efflux RND transporter periplasmic adaptor subunit [Streptobacillus felis]NYV27353.1 efflux RND transporter periplasmic adaptor subunit [Streptobacillus felis]
MKKMSKKKKVLLILTALILIAGAYKLFSNSSIEYNEPVETHEAVKQDLNLEYTVSGEVYSEKEVLVFSNLPGKVNRVNFRKGDLVKKGDVLVELDSSSMQEINSNIFKLKINLSARQKEYSDALSLYKIGGVSKNEVDRLADAVRLAQIDLNNAYNNSDDFSNRILSTVSGVITESNVDENLKIDQSKYLFKIVDVENLKIQAEIPNSKIRSIKEGDKVIIKSDSLEEGKEIEASISEISKISKKNQQFNDAVTDIVIKVDSNSGLKPGDLVNLKISLENIKDVVVVNFLDVVFENNKPYVYTVDKDGKVKKNEVILGKTNNEVYEIKSGINKGDRILNNIDNKFKEGDKVQ